MWRTTSLAHSSEIKILLSFCNQLVGDTYGPCGQPGVCAHPCRWRLVYGWHIWKFLCEGSKPISNSPVVIVVSSTLYLTSWERFALLPTCQPFFAGRIFIFLGKDLVEVFVKTTFRILGSPPGRYSPMNALFYLYVKKTSFKFGQPARRRKFVLEIWRISIL